MKAYEIKGKFLMKNVWQPFTKEIEGENEEEAKEKILSIIGSLHKVKRNKIKIEEIKELQKDEITDPVVKYKVEKNE